jgi:transcriptional regulator with XRE-family HTH domain
MTETAHSIDLKLGERLQDRETRQRFFLAESSSLLASQLVKLRKRRGLNQTEVAEAAHTQQPAISRMERADNQSWSFSALRRLADVLDARIRVYIEASEDVLKEYEEDTEAARPGAAKGVQEAAQPSAAHRDLLPGNVLRGANQPPTTEIANTMLASWFERVRRSIAGITSQHVESYLAKPPYEQVIADLKRERDRLTAELAQERAKNILWQFSGQTSVRFHPQPDPLFTNPSNLPGNTTQQSGIGA